MAQVTRVKLNLFEAPPSLQAHQLMINEVQISIEK